MSHGQTFGGTVVAVDRHRFQLRTHDGDEWLALSKWNDCGGAVPPVGAVVAVRIDAKGYVRDWTPAQPLGDEFTEEPPPVEPPVEPPKPAQPAQQEAPRGPLPSRDVAITRMACLNTATAILSSGGREVEPADAVKLAARLEQWVNR